MKSICILSNGNEQFTNMSSNWLQVQRWSGALQWHYWTMQIINQSKTVYSSPIKKLDHQPDRTMSHAIVNIKKWILFRHQSLTPFRIYLSQQCISNETKLWSSFFSTNVSSMIEIDPISVKIHRTLEHSFKVNIVMKHINFMWHE